MRCNYMVLGIGLMLCGCHKTFSEIVVGSWKESQHSSSIVGALAAAFVPSTSLELKSDHSFLLKLPDLSISISGNSGSVRTENWVEGTWDVDGTQIRFSPKTVGGKPIDQVRKELAAEQQQEASQAELQREQQQAALRIQQQEVLRQQQAQALAASQQQAQAGQGTMDPSQQVQAQPGPSGQQFQPQPQYSTPQANASSMPSGGSSHLSISKQLVIPESATLSDDQRRLQIRFKDAVQPPVEVEKQ